MDDWVGCVFVGERGDGCKGDAEDGDAAEERDMEAGLSDLAILEQNPG